MKKKPNIILLYSDQQKAASLDVYNQECTAVNARNLRRLIEQGTLFENAYCAYPLCLPSRISVMNGKYPVSSGYIGHGDAHPALEEDTLLDRLKGAEYTTYLAGKEHAFSHGDITGSDLPPLVAQRYDHVFAALHNTKQPLENAGNPCLVFSRLF